MGATVAMAAPAAEPKPEAAAEAEPMCFPWEKCWHQGREAEPAAEVRDAEPKKKKAPKKVHKGREAESEPAAEPRCVDLLCPEAAAEVREAEPFLECFPWEKCWRQYQANKARK